MYKLITTTMLCAMLFSTQAQITFEKKYGGYSGYSFQQTADGGFVIAGKILSGTGYYDVYLVKTDASGDTMWTKAYGGSGDDIGKSIQQTADGGYVIAGYTESFGAGSKDIYLIKTDASGDTMWTKAYGGTGYDAGNAVQQTTDGGYVITGSFDGYSYLIKTDASGDMLWEKYYAYGGCNSVQQTADGGYVIVGGVQNFGPGSEDVYLIKTDALGDTMWTKVYGGTGWDVGYSVQLTADGGFVIAGVTKIFGTGSSYDIYLIKTDASGDTMWTKSYGVKYKDDFGFSAQQTADGGYVITGYRELGGGNEGVYLIRTDASGDIMWAKLYGAGTYNNRGYSVQQTVDGGYAIVGNMWNYNVYLVKTDTNGNTYGCNSNFVSMTSSNTATQVGSGGYYIGFGTNVSTTSTIVYNTSEVISDVNVPTISLSFSSTNATCAICNGTATVNATGTYPPFSYQWNDSLLQTSDSAYGLCAGTYYTVTVTDAYACTTATDSITITNVAFPQDSICLITVDSTSTKNVIVWEKPATAGIDSFKIYRDIVGTYTHIGSVAYSDLSVFTDTTFGINPNSTAYKYKISVLDTCGNESVLSDFHKTIHLIISLDVNQDPVLQWNDYEGFVSTYYRIMRDSMSNGNWEIFDSVSFGTNSYTDINPPQTADLRYRVSVVPSSTCTATTTKTKTYNQSKSNYANKTAGGTAPVADFIADKTIISVSDSVNFFDISTNTPTSWTWIFSNGTPSTSSAQHPTNIAYNVAGCYDVTLIATNAIGSNVKIKSCYIDVSLTGIGENQPALQNLMIYPNPYTGKTQITYYLPEKSNATLEVYNLLGKKLHTLADGVQSQGKYSYEFSAKELGYSEGIYLVKLSTSGKVLMKLLVEMN